MNTDANAKKALVRRYYDEVWSQGRLELVDQLFHPEYENHDPATPGVMLRGREAFKGLVATLRGGVPNMKMRIDEQVCEGDVVVTRWTASGEQTGTLFGIPPTGRSVDVTGVTTTRFRGEHIVSDHAVWDTLGMLRALGAVPTPG